MPGTVLGTWSSLTYFFSFFLWDSRGKSRGKGGEITDIFKPVNNHFGTISGFSKTDKAILFCINELQY